MSHKHCECLDCRYTKGVARAMNRSNDPDDDEDGPDSYEPMSYKAPAPVPPPNDVQIKAWVGYANECFDQYKVKGIPMPTLVSMVAQKVPGLKPENYQAVTMQMVEAFKSHPDFEIRRGKSGGVFRREKSGGSNQSVVAPSYITLTPATDVPDLITGKLVDNCTCKGCGTGLNSSERSCWKCGTVQ